jgi:hypothetical protein
MCKWRSTVIAFAVIGVSTNVMWGQSGATCDLKAVTCGEQQEKERFAKRFLTPFPGVMKPGMSPEVISPASSPTKTRS